MSGVSIPAAQWMRAAASELRHAISAMETAAGEQGLRTRFNAARSLAVARTNAQTALLWLTQAMDEEEPRDSNGVRCE